MKTVTRYTFVPILVAILLLFMGTSRSHGQSANFPGSSSGSSVLTVLPGYGTTLMAWYEATPTETLASLTDYSGNNRTASGTTGTAPTLIAGTGGIACNNAGGVLLPTALNSAKTIMVWLSAGTATHAQNSIIAGSGTTWTAFNLQQPVNSNALSAQDSDSTSGRTTSRYDFWGTGSLTETFDTNNKLYQNGVEYPLNYFSASNGSSAGIQVDGQYSVCGFLHGTSASFMNTGTNIYQIAFWSTVLTPAQIAAADQVMSNLEYAAGVFRTPFNNTTDTTYQILGTGDSIGAGAGITQAVFNTSATTGSLVLDDTWSQTNLATSGFTAIGISGAVPSFYGQLRPQAGQNINAIWAGTNDIRTSGASAQQVLGYVANNCRQTKVAVTHAQCLVFSVADITGFDAGKNSYDALLRQKWSSFADGFVDLASDPNMGADGAAANTLYFQDGVHPTQHASYNDLTPMVQRAINRMFGVGSFSSATPYVAAAAAATAVTATSQATNTMTFTTALNPPLGSSVTCTGITPAGYNSPNTGWFVLTTSGASFTAYNGTTGLGAGSVFGTCSVPVQRDKDVYTVLNFGAGNFTLESCMGWTGQNLYIKNINAAGSTVVPFASETIDGAASLAVASKATLILQSILTSSAAGGCNWRQLQNN